MAVRRLSAALAVTAMVAGLVPARALDAQSPPSVLRYAYDDLGRLIAVTDSTTGQVARYEWDAAGNLLRITRDSTTTVAIFNFVPKAGPPGTAVTVDGAGFSATPSENAVTFNGVVAVVTSATASQFTVTVPEGASSGLITVTAPGGAATSAVPFTVPAPPTITEFFPTSGQAGTSVTIQGSGFSPIVSRNTVRFNGIVAGITVATATQLVATVPATTTGPISVSSPNGSATSVGSFTIDTGGPGD